MEIKPKFFKVPAGRLITSNLPWQRLSLDYVGPLPSRTNFKYILVIIDEFSRFPFAFPCSDIGASTVIKHLSYLFSIFGNPSSIHSDRGPQFESLELNNFLLNNGIVKTRTTPYNPQGNGQCERANGIILKTINLTLREQGKDKHEWESVLNIALNSI